MCDRAYHLTRFGCTGEVCTMSRCEKGQCMVPQRLANCEKVRVRIIHGLTLVIKNSYTYCKSLLALEAKYYYTCSQGKGWQELTIARSRPPHIRKTIKETPHASNLLHNGYHTCMLRDLQTSTQVFLKFTITSTSMTLILPPSCLKTIIKHQVDHSIQFTSYDSFYYTQLGCPSFQDQFYNHRKYHAVLRDSQNNISES